MPDFVQTVDGQSLFQRIEHEAGVGRPRRKLHLFEARRLKRPALSQPMEYAYDQVTQEV
jgi:hypothetical protein